MCKVSLLYLFSRQLYVPPPATGGWCGGPAAAGLMAFFPEYLSFDMNHVDDNIEQVIIDSKIKETTRKMTYGNITKHLSSIADSAPIAHTIEDASKEDVSRVLCAFTIETYKNNGDNYEVSALRSMFGFFGTYVKEKQKRDVDRLVWVDLKVKYNMFCH